MIGPVLLLFAFAGADVDVDHWWKEFHDPQLESLVSRAVSRNRDLRGAAARVAEARAMEGTQKSTLLPSVNLTNAFNKIRGGYAQGVVKADSRNLVSAFETNSFQAGFDASWELDFFGRNRKGLAAARADTDSADNARRDVEVTVVAEVARTYVQIRGLERRLEITRRNIATQKDTLALTRSRAEAGLTTQLDVERQIVQLATTEAAEPALESERLQALERLAVLVDEPSRVKRDGSSVFDETSVGDHLRGNPRYRKTSTRSDSRCRLLKR